MSYRELYEWNTEKEAAKIRSTLRRPCTLGTNLERKGV
jgi:hypothetical protein